MTDEDELVAAVKADEGEKVRVIHERNPFLLRMPTPEGTLVLTAVYHGSNNALKALLERTPEDALNLYEASATGNPRRLKTILGQSRARVNDPNPEGFTPLGLAAFFGRAEAVRVLETLVNQDSGTYDREDVNRLAEILAGPLRELGFAPTRFPQSEYGDHWLWEKLGTGGTRLLCVSHIDTVFARGTAKARP